MITVGIDLGGTKIQGVVLDGPTVIADAKLSTPGTGGPEIAKSIAECIEQMGRSDFDRVGIGAPGVIDRANGRVLRAPNLAIQSSRTGSGEVNT